MQNTSAPSPAAQEADVIAIDKLRDIYGKLRAEIGKVIIGQNHVVEKLLTCIFARGHALLMGVPGLAKTLLIHSLADVMQLNFSRIQFTPDLMPSDITGTEILQDTDTGRRQFEFIKGPIFANIVLADEINRTPPKTQAALLQAMQEQVVSAGKHKFTLEKPFFVLATQNPRAVQYLVLGAKARAVLQGSYLVRLEDVQAVAEPVLAHRILVNFHAESEGVDSAEIIRRVMKETEG